MDFQKTINTLVKAGLTEQAIASRIKVSQSSVSRIRSGLTANPKYLTAVKLRQLYDEVRKYVDDK